MILSVDRPKLKQQSTNINNAFSWGKSQAQGLPSTERKQPSSLCEDSMMYNVETIVVTESGRRTGYDIKSAFEVAKKYNGILFYRCKEIKVEEKIVFSNNTITEFRVKYNHKVIDDLENYGSQNVENFLDYLNDIICPPIHSW